MIGEATLNAYDINKRISIFYRCGFLFFFSTALFSFIAWRVSLVSKFISSAEFKIFNYTSIAGISFYFYNLWTHSFDSSYELIYCIHKVMIAGCVLRYLILKKKAETAFITISLYTLAFVIGVSAFFVISEAAVLFHLFPKPDFLILLFISSVLFILMICLRVKRAEGHETKVWLDQLFYLLIPLAFIPLLSFFKDEIYLILNRHQIYFLSPRKLYLLFLAVLMVISYFRFRRFKKGKVKLIKSNPQMIALRYLPILVAGLATFTFYSPFVESSSEMFEAGNRFLPLMEFQKFGVIPIFEKFNSHVLSELFFGGLYALFNGLHSREMFIYEFIYQVFRALMVYFFILKITRNAYAALFTVFLFPLAEVLFLDYTIIAFLAIFVTDKIIREPASFRNYFLLITCLAFLLLWRVDIGYPAIISSAVVLLVYLLNREQFNISWKIFFKALILFTACFILILVLIGLCRNINVFDKLRSGLNYLASAQTYGLTSFGDSSLSLYKMEYFVFPVFMILFFGAMLMFFKKLNTSKMQRFIYSSFLFLTLYYFVNLQRGLVRHSFIEGHDNAVSSFVFLIISGSVFIVWRHRSLVFRFIAFVVVSTVLMMNYRYPAINGFNNLYSQASVKMASFSAIEPKPDIVRCIDSTHYEEKNFGQFKKLIASLDEKQTFIDFSNLPMLYYFTGKISPSYFYQNPLTIHNDYLQKKFIKELGSYDAPLIVFSNFPETWWDNVDGVPNTMRHYRLAEYFYSHYKPYIIVNKLCVWKKDDAKMENSQKVLYSFYRTNDTAKNFSLINYRINRNPEKQYFVKVNYANDVPEIKVDANGIVSKKPDFNDDIKHTAYYILQDSVNSISVSVTNTPNINSVFVTECDYLPDFYSAFPQRDDLKQLAYIWASYDDSLSNKKIILDLCKDPQALTFNNITYFNFNTGIDKSTGDGIFITLESDNEEPVNLDLLYGSSKEGYKGAFGFILPPGNGERSFYVRISSQYNWYDKSVDYVGLVNKSMKNVNVKNVEILKGD